MADQDDVISPGIDLGQRIKILRKSAGLTQQQVADALGVSRPAIAFWETGREGSARKHIPKLAALFNVDPEIFLTGYVQEDIELVITPDEHDVIRLYRMLDPSRKVSAQKWLERQARMARQED
ncbi:transcriptional regulator [Acetobacter pasteurianus]|uniref:HTH cro/C1-type domain-containing protein n=10 Tax=Acetobacter TaxID=434 RepID=F1YSE0_9PROT|nr:MULTISPECIES: helix-turn-helix transcriptional regulator [Acetobacter]BAU39328.1 transcriptional regulator [Acetobacter pasteurianus NBRC 101655]GBR56058.1 transcriptional regulator [Acetobacter senegalensis DSM 18889]GCD75786.1 transcriptional regulator [Acetobacter pasteurianus NBRC 3299]AKR47798.1 transcriptional regulator [Acetobacter pasteurianus]ANA14447.1 transcriptional regulator [Acetobacter oryzifermentans]